MGGGSDKGLDAKKGEPKQSAVKLELGTISENSQSTKQSKIIAKRLSRHFKELRGVHKTWYLV